MFISRKTQGILYLVDRINGKHVHDIVEGADLCATNMTT